MPYTSCCVLGGTSYITYIMREGECPTLLVCVRGGKYPTLPVLSERGGGNILHYTCILCGRGNVLHYTLCVYM